MAAAWFQMTTACVAALDCWRFLVVLAAAHPGSATARIRGRVLAECRNDHTKCDDTCNSPAPEPEIEFDCAPQILT